MIYRVKFKKGDSVKYIAHLDIQRLFQRAIKRAKLDVSYSKGFNPHQLISFANPLSLGMQSDGEYCDIRLNKKTDVTHIKDALNEIMPIGILVINVIELSENAKNSMSIVRAASYTAVPKTVYDEAGINEGIKKFLSQNEIVVSKKSKKGTKDVDILPLIYSIKFEENRFSMFLSAGNTHVKCQLVLETFFKFMDMPFDTFKIFYTRNDLFQLVSNNYVTLDFAGE